MKIELKSKKVREDVRNQKVDQREKRYAIVLLVVHTIYGYVL